MSDALAMAPPPKPGALDWVRRRLFSTWLDGAIGETPESVRDSLLAEVAAMEDNALPDGLRQAKGIWLRRLFPREGVLDWRADLVRRALKEQATLWPLYRFWADAEPLRGI